MTRSISQQLGVGKIVRRSKPESTSEKEVEKRSYTDYLHGSHSSNKPTETPTTRGKHIHITSPKKTDVRIIRNRSRPRNRSSRSKKTNGPDPLKDIFKLQLQLQEKKPSSVKPSAKPSVTPPSVKPRKRSSKKRSKRSTKRHTRRIKTKGRNVKINHKHVSPDDMKRIENKILSIRNKTAKDIKEALEKDGIKVSGKSTRLLKDIYFYSKVCNINIRHEI